MWDHQLNRLLSGARVQRRKQGHPLYHWEQRLADFTRESITGTTVVVYPEGVAEEQYTRSKREETIEVGLAVFKPCEADAEDNIGDGLLLCQEIREAIAGVAMSGCDWTGTTQPELYEREFAEQLNQFASTLTATYKREV